MKLTTFGLSILVLIMNISVLVQSYRKNLDQSVKRNLIISTSLALTSVLLLISDLYFGFGEMTVSVAGVTALAAAIVNFATIKNFSGHPEYYILLVTGVLSVALAGLSGYNAYIPVSIQKQAKQLNVQQVEPEFDADELLRQLRESSSSLGSRSIKGVSVSTPEGTRGIVQLS